MREPAPSNSTRLLRKGALIEETYRVFAHWDASRSLSQNLDRIRETNPLGARNQSWLREITTTLSGRFGHGDSIDPLVVLAKAQYPLERWRYCLLWHFGSTDGLYRRFAEEILFPHLQESIVAFDTEAVLPFIKRIEREKQIEPLSDYGRRRAARDLLRMAAAFGLVAGRPVRRFTNVAIPEDALLYALYDLMGRFSSASRAVHSRRWRMFLMKPEEVEHELFNLHQFRRLRYDLAGTVRELALPHENLLEFTKSLAA
jgi:hypothetical protein